MVMVKVVKADFQTGGRSIFPHYLPLANTWSLTLKCGHIIDYPVRYPKGSPTRGAGFWRRHVGNDELPPPKKVKCRACTKKEKV